MAKVDEDGQMQARTDTRAARWVRAGIQLTGVGSMSAGAWMLSPAAGLIVFGGLIVGLSVLRWVLAR